jgi:putative nucleotidyltransferase with HDIG domain
MRKRIKQFVQAWRACIKPADRIFIGECLSRCEQDLFYGMSVQDQYHCRRVAADILRLATRRTDADRQFLVRCALLHDVGRRWGDVSTWDKVAAVLLHYFAPDRSGLWAREGQGTRMDNLRHALYVCFFHPKRGALLLRKIGSDAELLAIVEAHHQPAAPEDPLALRLLRQADDMN